MLVTGASSGLGRVMAETMAAKGYFVYAGARKAMTAGLTFMIIPGANAAEAALETGAIDVMPDIETDRTYRLESGKAGIFDDGRIHSIEYPAGARFIRITGCDLAAIPRGRYDMAAGTMDVSFRETFTGSK